VLEANRGSRCGTPATRLPLPLTVLDVGYTVGAVIFAALLTAQGVSE